MGPQKWCFVPIMFVTFYSRGVFCRTSCSVNLNAEYKAQEEPLFLDHPGTGIIYPNNKASIEIAGGEKLRVYCGNNNFKNLKVSGDSILVQCNSGKSFKILSGDENIKSEDVSSRLESNSPNNNPLPDTSGFPQGLPMGLGWGRGKHHDSHAVHASDSVEPKSFACRSVVRSAIRPGKTCGLTVRDEKYQEYSIGFPLGKNFLPLISVCFNNELKSVLWSGHVVSPKVEYHMSKVPRIKFIQDSIPYEGVRLNVNLLYSRFEQKKTIAALLNSKALAEKYIEPKGNGFFTRGHLAPKGDFVYAGEQLATFHFINVAPQWQYFNGGQWEKIESTLRNYIIKAKSPATVVTLTLGITELEDENGNERDIFLFYNQANEDKLIKVPKLYAKIINFGDSSANDKNVVIVGVNQPYESHEKLSTNDVICRDVCHKYPWISGIARQNDHQHSSGYIYCCTPAEFMSYLKSGQGYMADYNSPRSRDFNGPRTQVQSSLTTENENSDATQAYRTHKLSLGQKSPHQTSEENETVRSDENKNSAEISDDPETNVSEDSLELPKTITKDHFESSNENNLEDLDSNEHRFGIENMDYGGEDSRLNAFGSIGEPELDNADDGDFRADSNTLIGELSDFLGTSS